MRRSFASLLFVAALGFAAPAVKAESTYYLACAKDVLTNTPEKCIFVPKVHFDTMVRKYALPTPQPRNARSLDTGIIGEQGDVR
jgi:hypothetical protein